MEDCQTPTSKKSNIEICDIYDIYGNRTGKTFIRGEPLSDGQFVMVVDVWIVNSKDEILIQKRSPYKKIFQIPGLPTVAVYWQGRLPSRLVSVSHWKRSASTFFHRRFTN